ncbi:MAG TPA: divalent-cation tolerance protein CutA [Verrucomicrobiae bacterium]|nr:divalent-cation tolerance protein CutA [Verrucomicrobiae bacterium]
MRQNTLHLILVTVPNVDIGRKLARAILESHSAACVNIVPGLESHYWWQGKLDTSAEALLLIKTTKAKLKALQKIVLLHHPYDTPEFVALPASIVADKYMAWVAESVKAP